MTTRTKPRISVNKLSEYIYASATRRKSIVIDAKEPKAVIVTRYGDAMQAIRNYLINRDPVIIEDAIIALESKTKLSDFQENDAKNSVELLKTFKLVNLKDLDGYTVESSDDIQNKTIEIKGVTVSVQPDIILYKEIKGVKHIGAIKISSTKTKPLSEDAQHIVALLVKELLAQEAASRESVVSAKACFSFDVFKKRLVCCPSSSKARMKTVEAACEEIALWWKSV